MFLFRFASLAGCMVKTLRSTISDLFLETHDSIPNRCIHYYFFFFSGPFRTCKNANRFDHFVTYIDGIPTLIAALDSRRQPNCVKRQCAMPSDSNGQTITNKRKKKKKTHLLKVRNLTSREKKEKIWSEAEKVKVEARQRERMNKIRNRLSAPYHAPSILPAMWTDSIRIVSARARSRPRSYFICKLQLYPPPSLS